MQNNSGKEIKKLIGDDIPFKHNDFDPNNRQPKILILGTRITEKSIKTGYYYFGLTERENCFWNIMNYCFNEKDFETNDIQKVTNALKRQNVVVSDLIYNCEYIGSSDKETVIGSEKPNIQDLIALVKQADVVILNGGYDASKNKAGTLNYFHKFLSPFSNIVCKKNNNKVGESGIVYFRDNSRTYYLSLVSTSSEARSINSISAYKGKGYKDKRDAWKKEIEEFLNENNIHRY